MDLTSNEPFWLVKNGLINSYPSIKKDVKTDVLVVGGGVTGALMAHKCIEDGYNTVLIDRKEIANGSTSATTSMLQYEIDVPLYKLTQMIGKENAEGNYWAGHNSIDELQAIVKQIESECGFKKKESLYYAAFKKDISKLEKEFEARKNCGLLVKWLSAKEIEENYQLFNTYGGILSKQGASIDAFKFTHDLLSFNARRGLQIFDRTSLKSTKHQEKSLLFTTDYDNVITTKKVIYCNGYESTEMIKNDFVKLLSTYAIIGEPNEEDESLLTNTLFWDSAEPYIYMRTTEDNRILIGGEDEEFFNAIKRDSVIKDKSRRLQNKLKKILPNYEFRLDFAWAGTFGETKDGLPYIGEHPDFKNSYFLLGFGGNGITFSVIGMNVISDMLHDKKHSLAKCFRFNR